MNNIIIQERVSNADLAGLKDAVASLAYTVSILHTQVVSNAALAREIQKDLKGLRGFNYIRSAANLLDKYPRWVSNERKSTRNEHRG